MSGNVRFDSISTSGFPLQTVEENHRNKIRQYLHENRLGTNELILANDCVTNSIFGICYTHTTTFYISESSEDFE